MHHLVEPEAAPARAWAAVDDDLSQEKVEEVVAAHDGTRGQGAGDGGTRDRIREAVGERPHVVEALSRIAELAPEEGIRPVGLRLGPGEERVLGRRCQALARGRVPASEAPRGVEGAVVDQVAKNVGTGRLPSVTLDQRPVGQGLDDVVPLAVEGEGRPRKARGRDGNQDQDARDRRQPRRRAPHPFETAHVSSCRGPVVTCIARHRAERKLFIRESEEPSAQAELSSRPGLPQGETLRATRVRLVCPPPTIRRSRVAPEPDRGGAWRSQLDLQYRFRQAAFARLKGGWASCSGPVGAGQCCWRHRSSLCPRPQRRRT